MGSFSGRRHSEESKSAMSRTKTGLVLTVKQRAQRKKDKTKAWTNANPEKIKKYDKKALRSRARANSERRRKLRISAVQKLGGRCVSSNCKWVNDDGSRGCTDFRVLQFDHVAGGGTKERKSFHFEALCKDVLKDEKGKYQLLCANCNWIKAFEKREFIFRYEFRKD